MSSTSQSAARAEGVRAARAVVAGDIGIIEGCRSLSALAHSVVSDWRTDDDFRVVGAVDSETDALPIGTAREYWDTNALKKEDRKIAEAEALYRDAVVAACKNIIRRFESG